MLGGGEGLGRGWGCRAEVGVLGGGGGCWAVVLGEATRAEGRHVLPRVSPSVRWLCSGARVRLVLVLLTTPDLDPL